MRIFRKSLNSPSKFIGALVYKSAVESISNTTWTHLSFDQEIYDYSSIHDVSTNNNRLTVPVGANKVIISGNVVFAGAGSGYALVTISKNDETTTPSPPVGVHSIYIGITNPVAGDINCPISSSVIEVVGGDYFTLAVYHNTGAAMNVNVTDSFSGASTWFSMEVVK